MDAEEILSSYLDRKIFTDGHNLSDLDILKCMEEYHLTKSKEESDQRLEEAGDFLNLHGLFKEVSFPTGVEMKLRKALSIAAGKEES